MKKKQTNPAVEAARKIGHEAWLAVRARPGAGMHEDRRAQSRATQRRRAIEDATEA